jgi:hypothetical protein
MRRHEGAVPGFPDPQTVLTSQKSGRFFLVDLRFLVCGPDEVRNEDGALCDWLEPVLLGGL